MRLKFSDYLIGLIGLVVTAMSFVNHKCEHVFVAVEQTEVKADFLTGNHALVGQGLFEGKEIICIKCFHKQKQLIDYSYAQPLELIEGDTFYMPYTDHPCNYFDMKYQFVDTVKIGHVIRDKKSKIINAY